MSISRMAVLLVVTGCAAPQPGAVGAGAAGVTTFDATTADAAGSDTIANAVAADAAAVADAAAAAETADAADGVAGADAAISADTAIAPGPVWDLAAIADQTAAACAFTEKHTVTEQLQQISAEKLSFQSFEYKNGQLKPIVIRAFAARPVGAGKLPGVVLAHGLGGMAQEKNAVDLAARLGMVVIAYTGPGGGDKPDNTSEGDGAGFNNGYKMFDVLQDVRGSWFWGHAVAAMRAQTCLQARPDVDAAKLGITGFSAGGVVSLLVAGHDPRVSAAVPMSGTLAWAVATQAPKAWQHTLLQKAGLSVASPEWQKLQDNLIAPAAALAAAKAHVFMLDGSTDEFFPLTAFAATYAALPANDHRASLAANFDHGCFAVSGVESKTTIEDRAKLRADGGQKMWFAKWFGTDSAFGYVPQPPQVSVQAVGAATLVAAVVDGGGANLAVDKVEFWASGDDAFIFVGAALDGKNGTYSKLVPVQLPANAIYYADVQYKTKALLPDKFSISSLPVIPAGLVPHVRAIDSCL